jgi:hypothetical protein
MTTMNSNRCSRWLVLLVAVSLALSSIPAAAAVDVAEDQSPDNVEVGSTIEDGEAVYTLTDLYSDYDRWVLSGSTDLESARWTIVWYGQADERLKRETISNESFQVTIDRNDPDLDAEPTSVEVRVQGDVPAVVNYTYDPRPSFTVATLSESPEGNSPEEIASDNATHYTQDSRAARTAIEDAQVAIDEADSAGADTSEAEDSLSSAISVYNSDSNFGEAQNLAERAQSEAEDAQSRQESNEQTSTLLLYGGIGLVVLLVLGGGLYWYRQQSGDDYGKLS